MGNDDQLGNPEADRLRTEDLSRVHEGRLPPGPLVVKCHLGGQQGFEWDWVKGKDLSWVLARVDSQIVFSQPACSAEHASRLRDAYVPSPKLAKHAAGVAERRRQAKTSDDRRDTESDPTLLLAPSIQWGDATCRAESSKLSDAGTLSQQQRVSPLILVSGALVATNCCPDCKGDRVCRPCNGSRKVPNLLNPVETSKCNSCVGTGRCARCGDHVRVLESFAEELESGSPGSAEACLQRAMIGNVQADQKLKSGVSIGAAGFGALLGTIVAPGIGTIIGLSLGKMLGDTAEPVDDWKQADLLYSLGILYASTDRKGEASQAWIKALTLNEKHDAARTALKEAL